MSPVSATHTAADRRPVVTEPKPGGEPAPTATADAPRALASRERTWRSAHVWAGCVAAFLATGPTSIAEFALAPALLVFLPRIAPTYYLWKDLYRRPLGAALLLLTAWLGVALLWSPDRAQGLEEFGATRFFAVALLLVPATRLTAGGRRALVLAAAAGFLLGNLVQALNAWAVLAGGPEGFAFGRPAHRLSGWWDPAVAGTLLTAALGLHLPAALMGRGRERLLAASLAGVTVLGLLASGSRGGWLASGGLLVVAFAVAIAGAVRTRADLRPLLAALAAILLVGTAGGVLLRDTLSQRWTQAAAALEAATAGDLSTADGTRLAMKRQALAIFADHPLRGVGTGGFGQAAATIADEGVIVHAHAHDTLLHAAASTGMVGVLLVLAVGLAGVVQGLAWVRRPRPIPPLEHRGRRCPARSASVLAPPGLGSYEAGPLFALVGLALATPFDTLHVSNSAAAATGLVLALCICPPRRGPAPPVQAPA